MSLDKIQFGRDLVTIWLCVGGNRLVVSWYLANWSWVGQKARFLGTVLVVYINCSRESKFGRVLDAKNALSSVMWESHPDMYNPIFTEESITSIVLHDNSTTTLRFFKFHKSLHLHNMLLTTVFCTSFTTVPVKIDFFGMYL